MLYYTGSSLIDLVFTVSLDYIIFPCKHMIYDVVLYV